jgi:hypothetical protein
MSTSRYEKEYYKNFNRLLREGSSEIRSASEKTRGSRAGDGGVKVIKRFAEQARRETNKKLGFTEAQAIKRESEKKSTSPANKAYRAAKKYRTGNYKK